MDYYLTKKTTRSHVWQAPIAAICTLMGSMATTVCLQNLDFRDLGIQLTASAMLIGMFVWPLFPIVTGFRRRRAARRFAEVFASYPEPYVPLEHLRQATGIRDFLPRLRKLIERGYLQNVQIDLFRQAVQIRPVKEPVREAEPQPAVQPQPQPERNLSADECDALLARIRQLNDEIADAGVSQRIDRIESVTRGINDVIRRRPAHADAARRYISYYLPATCRLLESYALMEDQSYQSANIVQSRRSIEAMLDKMIYAAEQQQDKLFGPEALNVETDIRVLETMLAQDGLLQSAAQVMKSPR